VLHSRADAVTTQPIYSFHFADALITFLRLDIHYYIIHKKLQDDEFRAHARRPAATSQYHTPYRTPPQWFVFPRQAATRAQNTAPPRFITAAPVTVEYHTAERRYQYLPYIPI
jgi:hypothetical protein